MPRSRMIRPEFLTDEKLASVSRDCRLFFVGLWIMSDDYGVVKGHPLFLRNQIFPYDDINNKAVEGWLIDLERIGCIVPFEAENEKFFYIRKFTSHQKVDHPSKQRNPEPPRECLASVSRVFPKDSRKSRDETETETKTETDSKTETETETDSKTEATAPGCTAPPEPPSQSPSVFIMIPLANGSDFPVTHDVVKELASLYPAIDVEQELRKIKGWNISHKKNQKTQRGIMGHIHGWMAKEQDRARPNGGNVRNRFADGPATWLGMREEARKQGGVA